MYMDWSGGDERGKKERERMKGYADRSMAGVGFLRVLRFPGLLAHEGPEGRGYIVELNDVQHCFAILRWIASLYLAGVGRRISMQMRMDHREMYHIFYPGRGAYFFWM